MVRISGISGLAKGDRDSSLTVDCSSSVAASSIAFSSSASRVANSASRARSFSSSALLRSRFRFIMRVLSAMFFSFQHSPL